MTTQNGADWWFPQYGAENPRVRPVATIETLQCALDEFEKIVLDLDPDKNLWKSRMDEVMKSGELIATAQIMRDLTVLRTQRKFNQMETKAFGLFKDRLLREWSAIMNTIIEVIEPELKRYLRVCKEARLRKVFQNHIPKRDQNVFILRFMKANTVLDTDLSCFSAPCHAGKRCSGFVYHRRFGHAPGALPHCSEPCPSFGRSQLP